MRRLVFLRGMRFDHSGRQFNRPAFGSKAVSSCLVVTLTLLADTSVWAEGRSLSVWSLNGGYGWVKHLLWQDGRSINQRVPAPLAQDSGVEVDLSRGRYRPNCAAQFASGKLITPNEICRNPDELARRETARRNGVRTFALHLLSSSALIPSSFCRIYFVIFERYPLGKFPLTQAA